MKEKILYKKRTVSVSSGYYERGNQPSGYVDSQEYMLEMYSEFCHRNDNSCAFAFTITDEIPVPFGKPIIFGLNLSSRHTDSIDTRYYPSTIIIFVEYQGKKDFFYKNIYTVNNGSVKKFIFEFYQKILKFSDIKSLKKFLQRETEKEERY